MSPSRHVRRACWSAPVKWVRRHPTPAAMLAASLLLAMMLVGGSLWLAVQQAHRRDAVEADLKEMAGLQESARWAQARAALERAEDQLEGAGPGDLRRRLGQARRDLDLVIQLDTIRLRRVTRGELRSTRRERTGTTTEAFQQAGTGNDPRPAVAVWRLSDRRIGRARGAWWRHWTTGRSAPPTRRSGVGSWRWRGKPTQTRAAGASRVLDPAAWEDQPALAELARTVPVASESVITAAGARGTAQGCRRGRAPFLQAGADRSILLISGPT